MNPLISRQTTAKEKWKKVFTLFSIVRALKDAAEQPSSSTRWARPRSRRKNSWETPGATAYLDQVWENCSSIGSVYNEVVNLLRSRLENSLSTYHTVQYLTNALSGFPFLMMEFKAFLPKGEDFSLEKDFDQSRVIRIESADGTVFRASFGLIHDKETAPRIPSIDDKFYHLFSTALFTDREDAILTLQGGDARHALDLMKELVGNDNEWASFTSTTGGSNDKRERIFRLMLKLSDNLKELPPAMYISGITLSRLPTIQGGFADIYQSSWNDTRVAVKRLRINANDYSGSNADATRRMFHQEVLIWWQSKHDHITDLLGIHQPESGSENLTFSLILPWFENGSIIKCVKALKRFGLRPPTERWLFEVADGLEFLHNRKIVHGDLRGPNILIDDQFCVRLTDFGLAVFTSTANSASLAVKGGNVRWMAPELHMVAGAKAAPSLDIYSFACFCVEYYTGEIPFKDEFNEQASRDLIAQAVRDGKRPPQPRDMPRDLWQLVKRCWQEDPAQRPTAADLRYELRARY